MPSSVIVFLQFTLVASSFLATNGGVPGSVRKLEQSETRIFIVREPNLYAPELYADNLDFIATLSDLPGARNKKSYLELSYQLYFIPEDKYREAIKRLPRGGSSPGPEHFHGKLLLAEGREKKTHLATLKERTITLSRLAFKRKVPDAKRTKFATLMTSYSLKIFDADLNTTLYQAGIFNIDPYKDDPEDPNHVVPRTAIYLSFKVTKNGTLNLSQRPPRPGATDWP